MPVVRSRANGLSTRHPLWAEDAGQLGAALLVKEQLPVALSFVSLDHRLTPAAETEGLRVVEMYQMRGAVILLRKPL